MNHDRKEMINDSNVNALVLDQYLSSPSWDGAMFSSGFSGSVGASSNGINNNISSTAVNNSLAENHRPYCDNGQPLLYKKSNMEGTPVQHPLNVLCGLPSDISLNSVLWLGERLHTRNKGSACVPK